MILPAAARGPGRMALVVAAKPDDRDVDGVVRAPLRVTLARECSRQSGGRGGGFREEQAAVDHRASSCARIVTLPAGEALMDDRFRLSKPHWHRRLHETGPRHPVAALASAGYRHLVLQCLRPCGAAGACATARGYAAFDHRPRGTGRGWPRRAGSGPRRGPNGEVWGFTKLGEIPGKPWRVHDVNRPQPPVVVPGDARVRRPPTRSCSSTARTSRSGRSAARTAKRSTHKWPVRDGYFETGAGQRLDVHARELRRRPAARRVGHADGGRRPSQGRGNSGVIFMGRYEVQVLDMYNNRTYADGWRPRSTASSRRS